MNNNQLPLATYEQAQRLKKAGFDWPCNAWRYDRDEGICIGISANRNDFNGMYSVPTVALALKWMRDVKEICVGLAPMPDTGVKYGAWRSNGGVPITHGVRSTYEAAESALLDELLTLIEDDCESKHI